MLDALNNFQPRPATSAAPAAAGPLPADLQQFINNLPARYRQAALATYDGNAAGFSMVGFLNHMATVTAGSPAGEGLAAAAMQAAKPLMSESDWSWTKISVQGKDTIAGLKKAAEDQQHLAEERQRQAFYDAQMREAVAAMDRQVGIVADAQASEMKLQQHLGQIKPKS